MAKGEKMRRHSEIRQTVIKSINDYGTGGGARVASVVPPKERARTANKGTFQML
jgi:hypothetical protein